MKISGVVKYQEIESGAWTIVTKDGLTYIPTNMPEQLKYDGVEVTVTAVPSDAMSLFMMGELIDIIQFSTVFI